MCEIILLRRVRGTNKVERGSAAPERLTNTGLNYYITTFWKLDSAPVFR
jgi:hypothetical protein